MTLFFSETNFNETLYNEQIKKKRSDLDKRLNTLYKNRDIIKETQQKQINSTFKPSTHKFCLEWVA